MSAAPIKAEISPLSKEFTAEEITVGVMIYKIDGNDGWTLEVALDKETSVTWTELFPTDQEAWDEFTSAVADVGLRELLDIDSYHQGSIH
jgi:hypothetical protein